MTQYAINGQLRRRPVSEKRRNPARSAVAQNLSPHGANLQSHPGRLPRKAADFQHPTTPQIQAQLEASCQRFADLYDFAPIGYLTLNHAGNILDINLPGAQLLDQPRSKIISRPLIEFITREYRQKYRRHLALSWHRPDRVSTELGLARHKQQMRAFVELISTPAPRGINRSPYLQCALVDCTERREALAAVNEVHNQLEQRVAERTEELVRANATLQAEIAEHRRTSQARRRSEAMLADFFERSPLALVWVEPRGRILRVNQAWLELAGCSREECLKHSMSEFQVEQDAAAHLLRCIRQREVVRNFRSRLRHRDGSIRHVLIDADGLWNTGRLVHSRWFVRDITQQVNLEREVLLVAERERRRIGQDLHDDLCQHLAGIEFLSQTLARQLSGQLPSGADRAAEIAQMIREAIMRTRELAHGLAPVQLERQGLGFALQELAGRTRRLFGVPCRFRSNSPTLKVAYPTSIHVYRIAQEAVGNAVKHSQAGQVDINLTRNGSRLALIVKDNGVGIHDQARDGKGMGLQVMQYRAGVAGGTLVVRANRSGGTTVICNLNDPDEPKTEGLA